MVNQISKKSLTSEEQRLQLPGYHPWSEFQKIKLLMADLAGVRVSYLDGVVEIMTIGENHEQIKSLLAILLALYFYKKKIDFIPIGSATREDPRQTVSFEPDESYYLGERKDHPDLAIEVTITSGSIRKLEKYQRLQIKEVWFWENNQIQIYYLDNHLDNSQYQLINQSRLVPDLDINFLVSCVQLPNTVQAMATFIESIRD